MSISWLNIGMIGYGAIGRALAELIERHAGEAQALTTVLMKPGRPRPDALCEHVAFVDDLDLLLRSRPDVIIECAGHDALRACAVPILSAGIDLVAISTGALVDDSFRAEIERVATRSGARLHLPSGAIAGIDGLAALRLGGLDEVTYTSVKPPSAWRGTPAERLVDLASLREATTFFVGPARSAAEAFPKNANLAATVAFAGLGLDRTHVHLVADPCATGNIGRITARGGSGMLEVTFGGVAMLDNPKTSVSTALSLARAVFNSDRVIII